MSAKTGDKGKHSPPGAGNIYAKANEVIVKITGDDTAQTFEVVEENCKPGFQSRAHYHVKAYETFYVFDGSADFQVGDELFHAQKGSCVHIPPGVAASGDVERRRAHADDLQSRRYRGNVCRHARAIAGAIDECRADKKLALKHDTVMIEQSKDGRGKGNDPWLTDCWRHALFNPQTYQQRFYGLALASGSCTLSDRSPIFGSAGHGWPP
jgi:mannose-6-phosphate isomerase-like protein (cupin superfamily)